MIYDFVSFDFSVVVYRFCFVDFDELFKTCYMLRLSSSSSFTIIQDVYFLSMIMTVTKSMPFLKTI